MELHVISSRLGNSVPTKKTLAPSPEQLDVGGPSSILPSGGNQKSLMHKIGWAGHVTRYNSVQLAPLLSLSTSAGLSS